MTLLLALLSCTSGTPEPLTDPLPSMLMILDLDGSGVLEEGELPQRLPPRVLDYVDTNGDGTLDRYEVRAYLDMWQPTGRKARPRPGSAGAESGEDACQELLNAREKAGWRRSDVRPEPRRGARGGEVKPPESGRGVDRRKNGSAGR